MTHNSNRAHSGKHFVSESKASQRGDGQVMDKDLFYLQTHLHQISGTIKCSNYDRFMQVMFLFDSLILFVAYFHLN